MKKNKGQHGHWAKPGDESGFSLIEVLIAMVLLAIGLLGTAALQVSAMRGNSFAGNISEANAYAQEKMEDLLALSYDNADLADGNATIAVPTSYTHPSPPPGYTITWEVDVDNPIPDTKMITVTAAWQERNQAKSTVITSFKSIY